MLVVESNDAGDPDWHGLEIAQSAVSGQPLVAVSKAGDSYELMVFPDRDAAAAHLVERLGLEPDGQQIGSPVELGVPGFGALLAAADACQAARLRARLARLAHAKPLLHAELLRHQVGGPESDTGWAMACGFRIAPISREAVSAQMADGVRALESAGLIRAAPRGYALTDSGEHVVGVLTDLKRSAGIGVRSRAGGQWATASGASAFVGRNGAWIGLWSGIGGASPLVRMHPASRDAGGLLRTLLDVPEQPGPPRAEPPLAGPVCSACGAMLHPTSRFCDACGTRVSRPEPRACPNCGMPIPRPGQKFCTGCASPLAGPDPATQAPGLCPNPACRKPRVPGKKFCGSCGTRMSP
jgi:hypothetical protein